jgi:threonine dehydratase
VLSSTAITSLTQANRLVFKCENFQKVGAFKFRGATNAILSLSKDKLALGVCTHSSGNHAAALSLAAKRLEVKAFIVMPRNAPEIKINAVKEYGGEIHFCEPTLAARESALAGIVQRTGAHEVHPYNDPLVIQGQSTCCFELLHYSWEKEFLFDLVLAPVGGGGLLSGSAVCAKTMSPSTRIIGCEPEGASDF